MLYTRRRHRRSGRGKRILLFLILAIALFVYAESRLPAVKADVQQATLRQFALEKIAETVQSKLPASSADASGSVALDTYALGAMQAELTEALSKSLSGTAIAWIPVGNLSGLSVLNGHGPKIPVFFSVEGVALVQLQSELTAAGINRTHYSVTLEISAELYSSSAAFSDVVCVSTAYPLVESVTQGEVPRYAAGIFSE